MDGEKSGVSMGAGLTKTREREENCEPVCE